MSQPFSAALVAAMLAGGVLPVAAGPCTKQIAAFEQSVQASGKNPDSGPAAPESQAATLGRQPTKKSVKQAEQQAQRTFDQALARAKASDAQGKRSACLRALSRAKNLFDLK